MNTTRTGLRFALGALFGLCAADSILQVRGLGLMPPFWENAATLAFFLLAGMAVLLAWREKDRKAMGRVRLWAGAVLLGSVVLLLLLWGAMAWGISERALTGLVYALGVVSTPVVCCTVLFWPVLAWAVLLVTSHTLCRSMDGSK